MLENLVDRSIGIVFLELKKKHSATFKADASVWRRIVRKKPGVDYGWEILSFYGAAWSSGKLVGVIVDLYFFCVVFVSGVAILENYRSNHLGNYKRPRMFFSSKKFFGNSIIPHSFPLSAYTDTVRTRRIPWHQLLHVKKLLFNWKTYNSVCEYLRGMVYKWWISFPWGLL